MDTAMNPQTESIQRGNAVSISASAQIAAFEARYASRGIVKAVQNDADLQEKREDETCELDPLSYRLSALTDRGMDSRYRDKHGEIHGAQLLTYINDTRALRTRETDFAAMVPSDDAVYANEAEKPCMAVVKGDGEVGVKERISELPAAVASLPAKAWHTVRTSWADWFNRGRVNTESNTHRFPVSAFAAILA